MHLWNKSLKMKVMCLKAFLYFDLGSKLEIRVNKASLQPDQLYQLCAFYISISTKTRHSFSVAIAHRKLLDMNSQVRLDL